MGIAYYDTLFNLIEVILGFPYITNDDAIHGMDWLPNSENFIWCKNDGVYKTNIYSKQSELLIEGCDANEYGWPSVSSDNSKILLEHYIRTHIEGNAYHTESKIVMTDINGMNEVTVELD